MLRLPLIILLGLSLTACGFVKSSYREFAPDRNTVYLEEDVSEPLLLPQDMEMRVDLNSPYYVPPGPLPGPDAKPLNLIPPGGRPVWDKAQAELAMQKAQANEQD